MNYIELFAGCGGLSLGLETAGFELLFANELSPMASETFAHNLLGADLETNLNAEKVFWLSSQYSRENLDLRLRENPSLASGLKNKFSDLESVIKDDSALRRSLLVGSIIDLNSFLGENKVLAKSISTGLGDGKVDLVSGGPPCQSFSLAGLRDRTNARNKLPWEFAKFIGMVKPKIALLENVSGILNAFNDDGRQFYAWFEVAKAFANVGYVPLCLNVNAKFAGVAQNRPRFILIAINFGFYGKIKKNLKCKTFNKLIKSPLEFYRSIKKGDDPNYGELQFYDAEEHLESFENSILSPLVSYYTKQHTVKDAIHDLLGEEEKESQYVKKLNRLFANHNKLPINKYHNHELRKNSSKIKARFRIYQLLPKLKKESASAISKYLKSSVEAVTEVSIQALAKSLSSVGQNSSIEIQSYLRSVEQNELSLELTVILEKALISLEGYPRKEIRRHLKSKEEAKLPIKALHELKRFWLLDISGNKLRKPKIEQIEVLVSCLKTKKQTQRVLLPEVPAPAALSIPDDACHYSESIDGLRTLTVREMARIQSFPDWYEVKSKVTTGGEQRRFEVPQYTQMGNAVPPMLGYALGQICKKLLSLS